MLNLQQVTQLRPKHGSLLPAPLERAVLRQILLGFDAHVQTELWRMAGARWSSRTNHPGEAIEQTMPAARRLAGFQGLLSLIDRATGKSITITLRQDENAMRASEEGANRLRAQGAEAAAESVLSVERYEVAFSEVSSPAA